MQGPLSRVSVVGDVGITQTSGCTYFPGHAGDKAKTEDIIMLVDWRERKKEKRKKKSQELKC